MPLGRIYCPPWLSAAEVLSVLDTHCNTPSTYLSEYTVAGHQLDRLWISATY